jgi:hypothetical protein
MLLSVVRAKELQQRGIDIPSETAADLSDIQPSAMIVYLEADCSITDPMIAFWQSYLAAFQVIERISQKVIKATMTPMDEVHLLHFLQAATSVF